MAEVFAGFLCGYILALVFTPVLVLALFRLRAQGGVLETLLPARVSLTAFAILLHGGLFLFWTAVGMLLGLLLLGLEDGGGGLGSRNLPFSLVVVSLTAVLVGPVAAVLVRLRPLIGASGLLVVGLFGWLMPYLAAWSTFGSS
jgi:hypothetical protein